jgi:hypothetical protein
MDAYRAEVKDKLRRVDEDLSLSLKRQGEDYEEAKQENIAKQQEVTNSAKENLDKQTMALTGQLTEATARYEKYKLDAEGKMSALEAQHKGVLGRVGDAFKSMFETAGDSLLRFVGEKLIGSLFNELKKLRDDILPGLMAKLGELFGLGGGGGGVLGTSVGGGIPGMPNGGAGTPAQFPKIPGPGGAAGSAAGAAASAATSSLTGIVGAVAGVVSAISDVIANFQLARLEGTLNAIEQHTNVLAIGLVGISTPWEKQAKGQISIFDTLNRYLPAIEEVGDKVRDRLAPYLLDIVGKLNALVVGTLTSLLTVGGEVKEGASATAASIAAALAAATSTSAASVESGLLTVRDKLVDLKSAVLDSTSAQTRQLENALGTLADNIYKSINPLGMVGTILGAIGGGVGSIGSSIGGIAGSLAGGLGGAVSAVLDQRQEGTLNSIEQHTNVMAIVMAGISAPWEKVAEGQDTMFEKFGQMRNALVEKLPWIVEFTHEAASSLKDYIQPTVIQMAESLRSIDSKIFAPAGAIGKTSNQSVVINVSGAGDPQSVAKAVMDLLKTQSPVFV